MKLIERNHCVFTGNHDLEHLYTFKDFPVLMPCVDHAPEKDIKVDMSWWISRSTGSIQLNPLIPLEILYSQGHGAGVVGCTFQQHHTDFSKFIYESKPKTILEIGGGHGQLAENYFQLMPDADWTIVEPNPSLPAGSKAHVVTGLFNNHFWRDSKVDVVIHSHVIEHMYDPFEFIAKLSNYLKENGEMIFAVPHLSVWLSRNYTNAINFEHTVYLTEPYIEFLLQKTGFLVVEKSYFQTNHSIFYRTKKMGPVHPASCPNLYVENKLSFFNFINFHKSLIESSNKNIGKFSGPVFLFGAHIFSQYLINFGLDTSKISYILDNNTDKQGKRLYGTNLMVNSPKILREAKKPAVILRAGIYNNEIKEDILNNINSNVEFWE